MNDHALRLQRLQAMLSEIYNEDLTEQRKAGLILCESCQKYFAPDEIEEEAGDGEGYWGDGHWGPISECKACYAKAMEEMDEDDEDGTESDL